jgi:DNA-binding CsgD family transcriptional regulator
LDTLSLPGRDRELARLTELVERAADGRSGVVVVSGEAGIGKTTLLDHLAERMGDEVRVRRIVAAESEMELAYAGLQMLGGPLLGSAEGLPAPQRDALETAFGLRAGSSPSPFLVGLATLGLLTESADDRGLLCIVDDAQWLDAASATAVALVARRLDAEGIALVLAMRTVATAYADLPRLALGGLGDRDARALLAGSLAGPIDRQVEDRVLAEARGNPLALRELPRGLGPADVAGGFSLTTSMPLESRIEQSLLAQLEPLPDETRSLLLLAAAEPTGDPWLLRRASEGLGLGPAELEAAAKTEALLVGSRVVFRHPLLRSAVYRAATPEHRRLVHRALADATDVDRDPDRRAWHRAGATLLPDEDVAADLERSAARARARGGAAAAAAFLARSAELTPDPSRRADRLIAAADAKHDAGAPDVVLSLVVLLRDLSLDARQAAVVERLEARARYALRRHRGGARELLAAAQRLEPLDRALARDTYIEALAAAIYGGRLGDADEVVAVSRAILDATADDDSDRARDLILRGQALLAAEGQEAAIPTLRRALAAFLDNPPDVHEVHWMWFASRAAQDLWDRDALRALADRQVELARADGVVTVLPIALSLLMLAQTVDGDLDAAQASCDEIDTIKGVTGLALPAYGQMFLAAYRGQADETERRARQVRADGEARGEGYAISAANFAEAILYNGLGRYRDSVEVGRRELAYTAELNHAMRTLLELVEAATRTGDIELAEEAHARLGHVTRPLDNDWALGVLAMATGQLAAGATAERCFDEALERFERVRIPIMVGRTHLLYGELLRRRNRRVDARKHLRAAHESLERMGLGGFADRAARELRATGEKVRTRSVETSAQLTEQELNVARLAREGLTNRDIGARLFISARTVEYHLGKVFTKLGIGSRSDLVAGRVDLEAGNP